MRPLYPTHPYPTIAAMRMRRLYNFLSSIWFTLFLLGAVALYVAAGTWIEALTLSHEQAALLAYRQPAFLLLLLGFFINILTSALRRWPWRRRHLPFLCAHLGLLMILTGIAIKQLYGLQGVVLIAEGSATNQCWLPRTFALHFEGRQGEFLSFPLRRTLGGTWQPEGAMPPELKIRIKRVLPHSQERFALWIKERWGELCGESPLPFDVARTIEINGTPWQILASRNVDLTTWLPDWFASGMRIRLGETELPLKDSGFDYALELSLQPDGSWSKAELRLRKGEEEITLPLTGPEALWPRVSSGPSRTLPLPNLVATPSLAFVEEPSGDQWVLARGPHGRLWAKHFSQECPEQLVWLDGGWAGYEAVAFLPLSALLKSRADLQREQRTQITMQLDELAKAGKLGEPLLSLFETARLNNLSLNTSLFSWLERWHEEGSWLWPIEGDLPQEMANLLEKLEWSSLPYPMRSAMAWTSRLLDDLEQRSAGLSALDYLQQRHWPLELDTQTKSECELYSLISQRIVETAVVLPLPSPPPSSPGERAHQLSALFRARGFSLDEPPILETPQKSEDLPLYTPLEHTLTSEVALTKLEDNRPLVLLEVQEEGRPWEEVVLRYDPTGQEMAWPLPSGRWKGRFAPERRTLPYLLRLQDGRQIDHPGSRQPFSYEADIWVSEAGAPSQPHTLAMNRIFEGKDATRFYLSNITPGDESALQWVQLAVNRDPAKRWLTYPGCLILCVGIAMLYTTLLRRRKQRGSR